MTLPRLLPKRIWIPLAVPFILLLIGTIGYKIIEGDRWSWFDALYMASITLTTVGYGETHPLSPAGRLFTIVFVFSGVFTLFFTATEIIRSIVSGEFQLVLGRDRMERVMSRLRDHVVIIGLGRMGKLVCQEFERHATPFVIIDRDPSMLQNLHYEHGIPLHGDATSDEILKHAGVERARALICVLPSDADNLYVTLSARVLNPTLLIVARAEEEVAEAKLRRVGANQVVAPYVIGGHRVAQAVLRPTVGHFLERAMRRDSDDYIVEEVVVRALSNMIGQTLRELQLHQRMGIVILSIRRANGETFNLPQGDTAILEGDLLVAVGHSLQIKALESLADPHGG